MKSATVQWNLEWSNMCFVQISISEYKFAAIAPPILQGKDPITLWIPARYSRPKIDRKKIH